MARGYILEMTGSRGFVATDIQFVSDNPALVASVTAYVAETIDGPGSRVTEARKTDAKGTSCCTATIVCL